MAGDFDRRGDDARYIQILKILEKLDDTLHDKGGMCERITIVETKSASTQIELSEHKSSHWQFAGLVIGSMGILATLIVFILPLLLHLK